MTVIVQITPEIGPGTGVGAVAHHLEQEWQRQGITSSGSPCARPAALAAEPDGGVAGRLALMARVVWFSTVGTRRARAYLRRHPDELSICHNDALAGDVYVNHGIVQAAMRARGHYWLRMVRNPLHLFTTPATGAATPAAGTHRLVVNLVTDEERLLREAYPQLRLPTVVIGNGVDVDRFRPPTEMTLGGPRAASASAPTSRRALHRQRVRPQGTRALETAVATLPRVGAPRRRRWRPRDDPPELARRP